MPSHKNIMLVAAAACIAVLSSAGPLAADAPSTAEEGQKLVGVLKSGAAVYEKAKACQRLAVIGNRDSVPVLAALLADEQLAHYARFALEPIPDASVDEALRASLDKLQGKLLIGAINSIGRRRDAKAIDALAGRIGGKDAEAAAASIDAISRIGGPRAAGILLETLKAAPATQRNAIAEACLACAQTAVKEGRKGEGDGLYTAVRKAEVPIHIKASAARGAMVAAGAAAGPLLTECLQAGEEEYFNTALGASREISGSEATGALVAQLGKVQPARQALVIAALGERGDRSALPAVIESTRSSEPANRIAAIRALGKLADATAVPVLLDTALQSDDETAEAARQTLDAIGGKAADQLIASKLEKADGQARRKLIELAGRRRIAAAVPILCKEAETGESGIRLAAISALGNAAAIDDLGVLIAKLIKPASREELAAVQEALQTAARRLTDKDGFASRLLDKQASAPAEARGRLLETLRSVGGPKALQAVAAAARENESGLQKSAVQILGEWQSEDAAPVLLGLFKASGNPEERRALLRSFSNVVSKLRFPKETRLGLCKEAMEASKDDAEREVVIDTLTAIPALETFPQLTPLFANPALKERACAAAVTISERIIRYNPEPVREVLKKVVDASGKKETTDRARKLLEQK